MTFLLPVLVFLLALTISLIIIRVGTMAFMLTGLSREAARFQAHSAFTGVGFTTQESETIVEHPVRRHIAMALMMLGNIGMATVIATLTAALLDDSFNDNWLTSLIVLLLGVVGLRMVASSAWVERQLNRPIAFALKQFSKLDVRDYVSLLELSSGFSVTEMLVEATDWIADKTLVESALAREGVLVLGIRRHTGEYIGAPSGNSLVVVGDILVIYGPIKRLEELDERSAGPEGDMAHEQAERQYDRYLASIRKDDLVKSE